MKIIPAIDVINGKCVRLTQGDYAQSKIYSETPAEVAKHFEDSGLQYLHLVDLDGARNGQVTNWETVKDITSATSLKIDFGGGIKTEEDIVRLFDHGIRQVNLGSIAVNRPERVFEWIEKFGADRIIVSADVRGGQVAINGWQKNAGIDISLFIKGFVMQGLKHVACTDIENDGMLQGPNINLYKHIVYEFPELNIIASGGVSSLMDIEKLRDAHIHGVIIGKAIYENKVTLKELSQLQ
jgi:phosphoribosylformimino-5-aminoimidazole carboxamide ribotide isomerase